MLSQALWLWAAYGSFTKGRKEICILIKLSIVKTFFLLYLFKTRRIECNEGFLCSLGRRHHPFPCIHRHGPKETPNTEGARAPWPPRLSRTHPFPGTGSETGTAPQTSSESHPFSDTPECIMKWDSGVEVAPQITPGVRSSHSEEWFLSASESL